MPPGNRRGVGFGAVAAAVDRVLNHPCLECDGLARFQPVGNGVPLRDVYVVRLVGKKNSQATKAGE